MKKLTLLLLVLLPLLSFSQKNMIMYNMRNIPQSIYANPAIAPTSRLNVSIPALGYTSVLAGRNDFKVRDVLTESDGNLQFDTEGFVNSLDDDNYVRTNTNFDMLHVGFASGQNYFHFNITDRVMLETAFPKEAAVLIREIWEEDDYFQDTRIEDFRVSEYHYREWGFGWARDINEQWSVGVKYKLLYGVSSIQTKSSEFVIDTDVQSENDTIYGLAAFDIQTSGVNDYWEGNYQNLAISNKNWSHAFDIGAQFKPNDKFEFSFAAIDLLAKLNWKNNIENYTADSIEVSLTPVSIENIVNSSDSNVYSALESLVDSLREQLEVEGTNESYTTKLPTRINLYGAYNITPKLKIGLLNQMVFYDGDTDIALKAMFNARVKRFLQAQFSYAIVDDQTKPLNLGVGLAFNVGFFQFFVMSENVFAPLYYQDNTHADVAFGLNLTFNRDHE